MIIPHNATVQDAIVLLAQGNPGALSVLTQLAGMYPWGTSTMLYLANEDITGSAIWTKYKDECNSDINTFCETLVPGGILPREQALRNAPEEYRAALTEAYDDLDTVKALKAKDPGDLTEDDMRTVVGFLQKAAQ